MSDFLHTDDISSTFTVSARGRGQGTFILDHEEQGRKRYRVSKKA